MPASTFARRRTDYIALGLILSVSTTLAYIHFSQIDRPDLQARLVLHNQVIAGVAGSPARYRVLVPYVAEGFRRVVLPGLSNERSFLVTYGIFDLASIAFLLVALYQYAKIWYPKEWALIGVLSTAGTMPMAFRGYYFQPWSLLEAGLFAIGLLAIYWKRYWLIGLLVVLASLNRETGLFLPLMFLFTSFGEESSLRRDRSSRWKLMGWCACYLCLWGAAFFGLRWWLGYAASGISVGELWARNTSVTSLLHLPVNYGLFLGVVGAFAVVGFQHAAPFVRRSALVVPFYVATLLIWGVWLEVRLLMSLYAVLVPLALAFMCRSERQEQGVS